MGHDDPGFEKDREARRINLDGITTKQAVAFIREESEKIIAENKKLHERNAKLAQELGTALGKRFIAEAKSEFYRGGLEAIANMRPEFSYVRNVTATPTAWEPGSPYDRGIDVAWRQANEMARNILARAEKKK
jgi:hypothetical protein